MFKKILVPLDGSELAERALNLATRLARVTSAQLTLIRVVPQFTILAADPMLYEEMNRLGEDESYAYIRSVANELDPELNTQVVIDYGPPADTIVNYAENNDVDLIVMSSNGRSGINRWIYGSVAERVLRSGPCATTVINARGEAILPDRMRILVPLDGSELAEKALQPAILLADKLGAEIVLFRVEPDSQQLLETASMQQMLNDIEADEVRAAENYLSQIKGFLVNKQIQAETVVTRGPVADCIIDFADQNTVNLIIMTSHGRTGLQRWVYGSVAEKILRGACCATMIIRDKDKLIDNSLREIDV